MYFVLTNISEVIQQAGGGKVHLDWKSLTYISENGLPIPIRTCYGAKRWISINDFPTSYISAN